MLRSFQQLTTVICRDYIPRTALSPFRLYMVTMLASFHCCGIWLIFSFNADFSDTAVNNFMVIQGMQKLVVSTA